VADLSSCGWCGRERAAISHRLPDGEALCAECGRWLRRETRGYPDCPVCKHRYWLMHLAGWGFRCLGCGLKFMGHVRDEESDYREPRWNPFIDHTGLG
jgi:hypothetical protein